MEENKPQNHELKTLPSYFEDILNGNKTFEWRLNDRDYQVGDYLTLIEFDGDSFTGRKLNPLKISYLLTGEIFNLPEYCVMSWLDTPMLTVEDDR